MAPSATESGPEHSETTPLLGATEEDTSNRPSEAHENDGDGQDEDHGPPLPKAQIFLLCLARLVEPVVFFSIFPYINKMILETGDVPETDVGFYSGLIESLFSLTQMIVMLFWGRASDRFGRKPVLVISLSGITIAVVLFGLSKKLWHMILFRSLGGVFAGCLVTIRTMISEHSTPWTQARAFSFFGVSGNLAIVLGPLLGGALANPADLYPGVFGRSRLFRKYPYLLPNLCAASISALATVFTSLFLEETLKRKDTSDGAADEPEVPMSMWEVLTAPGVVPVLWVYCHCFLLGFAVSALVAVFLFTKANLGGLGFTPGQISIFMFACGLSQISWTLLVFPPMQHRFGTGNVLRFISWCWPIVLSLSILGNLFLRQNMMAAFWIVVVVFCTLIGELAMCFTGAQLIVNDIAPSPATLGTLNGIALSLVSGIRAIVPALFGSIFAFGVRHQLIYGQLAWVVLIATSLPLIAALRWLPAKAEGKLNRKPQR